MNNFGLRITVVCFLFLSSLHSYTLYSSVKGKIAYKYQHYFRTVFYRALFLLKHGIQPVIVLDGKTAPEVKSQTLQDRSKRTYGDSTTTGQDRVGLQAMSRMVSLKLR